MHTPVPLILAALDGKIEMMKISAGVKPEKEENVAQKLRRFFNGKMKAQQGGNGT